MTRRDRWAFWAGTSAAGALFGALLHSVGLVVWNMLLLGWDIYMAQRAPKGE